jgi:hypothetical protein
MDMHSHDDYYDIEAAIRTGDLAYARERIREVIRQQPTAEAWYLAALVARTPQQRRSLLEKALSSDLHHERAREALAGMGTASANASSDSILARLRRVFSREMA